MNTCFGYTNTGRIDPRYFIKESRDKLLVFEKSPYKLMPLGEIADFRKEGYNPKKEPEKEFLYIEINDVHIRTGRIRK